MSPIYSCFLIMKIGTISDIQNKNVKKLKQIISIFNLMQISVSVTLITNWLQLLNYNIKTPVKNFMAIYKKCIFYASLVSKRFWLPCASQSTAEMGALIISHVGPLLPEIGSLSVSAIQRRGGSNKIQQYHFLGNRNAKLNSSMWSNCKLCLLRMFSLLRAQKS